MDKKKPIIRCKPEVAAQLSKEWRRSVYGLLSQAYNNLRRRSEGRKPGKEHIFKGLSYPPRDKFLQWAMNGRAFIVCYKSWVDSGYNKCLTPTVTRINKKRGYDLDNIMFLSHSANSVMTHTERWPEQRLQREQELNMVRRLINVKT